MGLLGGEASSAVGQTGGVEGSRVGNFRQKNNSAEDGIDGTNGYFRRNSGCSAEQKSLGIPFRTFRGRENNSEFRSVEQKYSRSQLSEFLLRSEKEVDVRFFCGNLI